MALMIRTTVLAVLMGFGAMGGTRDLIEQALNEPAKIQFDNVRLVDAMQAITGQTGVKIVMNSDTMRFAPGGPATVIQRVNIANVPLRQGLTQLFAPLGMEIVVRDSFVEVVPREEIFCLGRAPTWAELDLLNRLAAMKPGMDAAQLEELRGLMQFQVSPANAWDHLAGAIRATGAGPGDQVLTVACAKLGWAWCVEGGGIVVTDRSRMMRRQLQQPIAMRMNSKPLSDVLAALGRTVNVPIRSEPGALASLPQHMQRNFSLNVQNEPVETVLEKIAGYTGLGYLIDAEGVVFYRPGAMPAPVVAPTAALAAPQASPSSANDQSPETTPPATTSSGPADPYVAKVVVPMEDGRTVEWLIRRSELPEDLRGWREEDLKKAFAEIREKKAQSQ